MPRQTTITRDALIRYLSDYLEVDKVRDSAPNGLQVEGRDAVRKIVTSVSASAALFEKCAALGADMIIVHHGLFWEGQSRVLRGSLKQRVKPLLAHDITLLGYHLPLDRHHKLGNNVLAAKRLGLSAIRPFGLYHGKTIGFCGKFKRPLSAKAFIERVNGLYGVKALVFPYGPSRVRTAGVISGGAAREVSEAIQAKLDAYVTGEACESIVQQCKEEGIHFISAGHYATERLGIRALGEHLAARFPVRVEYLDFPVPV
jgi:dinuclear metal center YbgI/SA1388 family protein